MNWEYYIRMAKLKKKEKKYLSNNMNKKIRITSDKKK